MKKIKKVNNQFKLTLSKKNIFLGNASIRGFYYYLLYLCPFYLKFFLHRGHVGFFYSHLPIHSGWNLCLHDNDIQFSPS